MGVALLVLLMALLVGPIIFFSALNTFMLLACACSEASPSCHTASMDLEVALEGIDLS